VASFLDLGFGESQREITLVMQIKKAADMNLIFLILMGKYPKFRD
jgi:hypothetical protein